MKSILYPLYAIVAFLVTIVAYLLTPLIALALQPDGYLPKWLGWFQTPDAPATGAAFWKAKNPTYSTYKLCVTWLWRNPAQGFDQITAANISYDTPVKVYGDLNINDQIGKGGWFLLVGGGVFQFAAVIPVGSSHTLDIGAGWRLDPIAKHYETPTLGALIATPFRLHTI